MTQLTREIHESIMAKAKVDPAFELSSLDPRIEYEGAYWDDLVSVFCLSTVDNSRLKILQHSDDASGPFVDIPREATTTKRFIR